MARPAAAIDWKEVEKLLKAGCDGVQVAAHLGIHPNTLYERCDKENGLSFSEYCQEKKSAGNALLIAAQFNKAMKGDSGMLKHLGEHRLGQKNNNTKNYIYLNKDEIRDLIGEVESIGSGASETGRSSLETESSLLDSQCTGETDSIQNELGTEGAV